MSHFSVSANFRTAIPLPSIDQHYTDLWKLAKSLDILGIPLGEWFPPAATERDSLLNPAFSLTGPSPAALAMAGSDKDNPATNVRTLGVWNGKEDAGGMAYTATYNSSRIPSNLNFGAEDVDIFVDGRNVIGLVQAVIAIWNPVLIKVIPGDYQQKSIFQDRPPAGWMIYLPFAITAKQLPEAEQLIPTMDGQGKKQRGTLVVTTIEKFDADNPVHVKKSNAIETRLVDQDLLPTLREFVTKF